MHLRTVSVKKLLFCWEYLRLSPEMLRRGAANIFRYVYVHIYMYKHNSKTVCSASTHAYIYMHTHTHI
jgi:hypothetical protein